MRYFVVTLVCFFLSYFVNAQQNKHLQLIPANENVLASLNVYSESTGNFTQYYVKDSEWIKNTNIPSIKTSFKNEDQKIQYISGSKTAAPSIFAYSTSSGKFEFYYLNKNKWVLNSYLPKGQFKFKSNDFKLEFSPGNPSNTAYIFGYSTDGKEINVLGVDVDNNVWKEIGYFPKEVGNN